MVNGKKILSEAMEDYLKCIFKAERELEKVTNSIVSERMGVTPASATSMIKKLDKMKLVDYTPTSSCA